MTVLIIATIWTALAGGMLLALGQAAAWRVTNQVPVPVKRGYQPFKAKPIHLHPLSVDTAFFTK